MTHAHITTWLIALILFFIAIGLQKNGKEKGLKIVHMILRLFYLLIIATGAMLLFSINIDSRYVIKAILGILVIGFFEMVLIRSTKGKSTGVFWGLLIVAFVITVYLGLQLPLGF
jgi:hypothetical protein